MHAQVNYINSYGSINDRWNYQIEISVCSLIMVILGAKQLLSVVFLDQAMEMVVGAENLVVGCQIHYFLEAVGSIALENCHD